MQMLQPVLEDICACKASLLDLNAGVCLRLLSIKRAGCNLHCAPYHGSPVSNGGLRAALPDAVLCNIFSFL